MDGPKVPDGTRCWESIDIFLFCNGQQHSPPRKYHLRCDELRLWDNTIRFLAQSLYGPMIFNIQLYTLDGKPIQSPLELKNDNAYVAVKPSDDFIWAGYEEYIIKASRSREKRQEKLTSSNTKIKLDDKNSNEFINPSRPDVIATEKTEGDITNLNIFNRAPYKDLSNGNMRTDSVCCERLNALKKNNAETESQKRNSKDILKNDMTGKNQNLKIYKKDQIPIKKKNSFLIRKTNPNNQIKPLTSQNNISPQVNSIEKTKDKSKEKTKDIPNIKNSIKDEAISKIPENVGVKQTNDIIESKPQSLVTYENNKNNNNNKIESNHDNILKSNANDSINYNPNNTISQKINTDFMSKDKNINIYLDIKLNGCANGTLGGGRTVGRCDSDLTLVSHKESQVNIDVTLNKENISFMNNVPKIGNSSNYQNNINENKVTSDNNKYIVVYCKCDRNTNIQSDNYLKENMNLAFLMPAPGKDVHSKREIKVQMIDKASQVSSSISTNRINGDKIDKVLDDTNLQKKVEEKNKIAGEGQQPMRKVENFTQTDMSNTLLQVMCEEDGHYTFCLPPLALLKKYNINTK